MRKSDDYAGNQVRILLNDLKNASHSVKMKAVEKFQTYITTYEPDITDDTVDYLFTGYNGTKTEFGLLYWSGVNSGKHGGQLKRICASIISLIRWLVTFETDDEFGNIFYERFVHLPMDELLKVNFEKHIYKAGMGDGKFGNQSRLGNCDDALQLLSILTNDHRSAEGEDDPVDLNRLLNGNKACQDHFHKWLQQQTSEHISKTTAQFKVVKAARAMEVDNRPTRWEDVALKTVPWQEGEEGDVEVSIESDEVPPIPDPLGISDADLRLTQELYASGRLFKTQTGSYSRRATAFFGSSTSSPKHRDDLSDIVRSHDEGDDLSSDEDEESAAVMPASNKQQPPDSAVVKTKKQAQSIIPSDKSFSTTLFLTLVHGSISFEQLQRGAQNLDELLQQQSSRRENLVRLHFGLFVQCADGLEWLKAFRKGVYKLSEMPKIKTYRRSSTEAGTQQSKSSSGVADKGMEKLRKAQTTLDFAKVEAQSTLAPILERMKQSRRVRSAEKVLRRMSAVLEHPHKMRLALDRGDLQEVVLIYQKVQAIPSTISLRILQRVKTAADSLVAEMKKQLTASLLTPSTNHHMLLRYSKIILDLDGSLAYLDLLRQCIVRQILHFVELAKELKDRFCAEAADAHTKSQELNMMNKSAFYSSSDREAIASALRKYAHSGSSPRPTRRTSTSNKKPTRRGSGTGGFYAGGSDEASDRVFLRHQSRDDFDVPEEEDDGLGEVDWLDFERESVNGDGSDSPAWDSSRGRQPAAVSEVDSGLQLSAQLRQHYLQLAVDTFAKWFPCLLRLVSEYLSVQAASQKKTVVTTNVPFLNSAMKSASVGSLPQRGLEKTASTGANSNFFNTRTALKPPVTKLLGSAMRLYSDFVKHVVRGVSGPFQAFTVTPELLSSFTELEVTSSPAGPGSGAVDTQALTAAVEPKVYELLASSSFASPLRDAFLRTVLREIYDLYDAVETTMNSPMAVNAILAANKAAVASTTVASNTPFARQLMPFSSSSNLNAAAAAAVAAAENYFLVPSSPFYDAMNSLQTLSKEGQTQVAVKIMDRLQQLCFKLAEFGAPSSGAGELDDMASDAFLQQQQQQQQMESSNTKSGKAIVAGRGEGKGNGATGGQQPRARHMLRLEQTVHDLEALISRCLSKVAAVIKRTDWVAGVVHEGVAKACMSFAEALRREGMLIEDSKSGLAHHSDYGVQGSPSGVKRSRKKSAGARASVSNGLVLQTIEEDLKQGALLDKQKSSLMLDLLRACIRLRNYSLPRFNKLLNKRFPVTHSGPVSAFESLAMSSSATTNTPFAAPAAEKNSSLLNKLFAFDSSPDPPARKLNKSNSLYVPNPTVPKKRESPVTVNANSTAASKQESKPAAAVQSLLERLTGSLDEDLLGSLLAIGSELAALEDTTVASYLEQRRKEIYGAVYAGYHLLARKELAGKWVPLTRYGDDSGVIPTHLSRLLLMIGHEKNTLHAELGKLTVELGGRTVYKSTRSKPAQSRWPRKRAPSQDEQETPESDEEGEVYEDSLMLDLHDDQPAVVAHSSADHSAGSSMLGDTSAGLRYSSHIYFELCLALIAVYEELVAKLRSNSFMPLTTGGAPSQASSGCSTPTTLGQALEELQYLKEVLKPLMMAHSITAGSTTSTISNTNSNPVPFGKAAQHQTSRGGHNSECYLSADQLAQDAKLFSMLLSN